MYISKNKIDTGSFKLMLRLAAISKNLVRANILCLEGDGGRDQSVTGV